MAKYFLIFTSFFCLCSSHLAFAVEQVPEVIVSQQNHNQLHDFTLANTTSISQQAIKRSGAKTITQLLNHRAGIQVRDLYGDGSHVSLSMRGFGDNATQNVLVMIDGQPLLNPDLGAIDFNSLPLAQIKRIDILPGSAGVLYGDQAVAGVVNIITKQPGKFKTDIAVSGGSYASQQYLASITGHLKNGLSYLANATHYFSNNYRDHNHQQQDQVSTVVNYRRANDFIRLRYRFLQTHLQYPGALSAQLAAQNRRQATNRTDFNDEQKNDVQLNVNHRFANDWHMLVDGTYNSMQGHGVLTMPFDEERQFFWLNPRLLANLLILDLPALTTLGVNASHGQYDLNGTGFMADTKQDQSAIYADTIITLLPTVKLNLGARGAQADATLMKQATAQQSSHNTATVSNIGLQWQLSAPFLVYLRRAGNYRFPKADENALSLNGMPLQTQTGHSYEIGSKLQRDHYGGEINLYQLDLSNEIIFIPSFNNTSLGNNQNLPPTRRRGIILSTYLKPCANWLLAAEYDQVNAFFSAGPNRGRRIPFVANNAARLSSDYQFYKHWHLYGEALYTGERFPAGDQTNQGQLLPSFIIYNASLNYHHKKWRLSLRINNLTNKKYNGYALVAMHNGVQTFFYPAAERNYWLSVVYAL